MIVKLLFLVALLFLLFSGIKKYKKLSPERQRSMLLKVLIFGLAGVLLIGVITGRMHWMGAVIAGILPLLKFGIQTAMRLLPLWLSRSGGVASFKTEHLNVQITVQSGQVRGSIIQGPCAGKNIEDLTDDELTELENYYRDRDIKSYYLIRFARKGHKFSGTQQQAPSFANPSRDEALQILGLSGNPTREEIIAAHRRLINKLHPDRGGSNFLAARVNQARDILLNDK